MSVHSSFLGDESSKQSISAKESRQALSKSEIVWKLWVELQGDFNHDDSIAETKLVLALS